MVPHKSWGSKFNSVNLSMTSDKSPSSVTAPTCSHVAVKGVQGLEMHYLPGFDAQPFASSNTLSPEYRTEQCYSP